jgi:integrase
VRQTTLRYLGVAITPHQFRHLAARRYLQAYPGHYEAVRQMLGHESVETTRRSYAGSDLDATLARHDALLTTDALDVRRQSAVRRRKFRHGGRRRADKS